MTNVSTTRKSAKLSPQINRILKVINSKGVKKVWIAEKCGISEPYLSMILSGQRKPLPKIINKIEKIILN